MEIFSSSFYIYLIVIVAFIAVLKIVLLCAKFERPKPRKLLTRSEYKFYFTLKEALPEYVILVQVGFAAMLQAKTRSTVNRFLAKRADYVICDQELNILLIVELDGTSHFGREKEDKRKEINCSQMQAIKWYILQASPLLKKQEKCFFLI